MQQQPVFQIPNLDYIRSKDPRFAEALQEIANAVSRVAMQTGAVPQGLPQTPGAPASLNVTAAGGIFDVAIQDNEPESTGVAPDYFLEYSNTQAFSNPVAVHLGPARNHRANLGNQTLYWRAYKQIGRASAPSIATYFGGAVSPTPVSGGGTTGGPNPLPSTGSGTSSSIAPRGGVGYGLPAVPPDNKIPAPGVL